MGSRLACRARKSEAMNLHQFYFDVWTLWGRNKHLRIGQCLFNHLADVRPDLSEVIRGTEQDPFHAMSPTDPRYDSAIKFIESKWFNVQ